MAYLDGFVVPVPKKNLKQYRKMAALGGKLWKKHGALEYKECVGDDLQPGFGLPFLKGIRAKPKETVFFSFIVYRSKADRIAVNKRVMKDPAMEIFSRKMPFDVRRMLCGGFKVLVDPFE